jgi:hypothetical protein
MIVQSPFAVTLARAITACALLASLLGVSGGCSLAAHMLPPQDGGTDAPGQSVGGGVDSDDPGAGDGDAADGALDVSGATDGMPSEAPDTSWVANPGPRYLLAQ